MMKESETHQPQLVDIYILLRMPNADRYILELAHTGSPKAIFHKNEINPKIDKEQYMFYISCKLTELPYNFQLTVQDNTFYGNSYGEKHKPIYQNHYYGNSYYHRPNVTRVIKNISPKSYFLLDFYIEDRKSLHNDNPLKDLAFYTIFFLQQKDYPHFTQFLEYFIKYTKENNTLRSVLSKEISEYLHILNQFLQTEGVSLDTGCGVFLTIGSLPLEGNLFQKKYDFLPKFRTKKMIDLNGVQAATYGDKFTTQLLRAIAITFYYSQKFGISKNPLEGFKIICGQINNLFQGDQEKIFIMGYLDLWNSSQNKNKFELFNYIFETYQSSIDIILSLAPLTKDQQMMMQALTSILISSNEQNPQIADKISRIVEKTTPKNTDKLEDLRTLLIGTQKWPEYYAKMVLGKEKESFWRCYIEPWTWKKTETALELIELAIKYPYMRYIRTEYVFDQFIVKILNWNIDITKVFTTISTQIDNKQMERLLKQWVFTLFSNRMKVENLFKTIEKILATLGETMENIQSLYSGIFEYILNKLWERGTREFTLAIKTIDKSLFPELTDRYIAKFEQMIIIPFLSGDDMEAHKRENSYDTLIKIAKSSPHNQTIIIILDKYKFDITEDIIIANLIENPNASNTWLYILESHFPTKSQELLAENIMRYYDKLCNLDISLDIGIKIRSMTKTERDICLNYLDIAQALEISGIQNTPKPKMVMEAIDDKIMRLIRQKDLVNNFLRVFAEEIQHSDILIGLFEHIFANYKEIMVNKFQYPLPLYEIAKVAEEYGDLLLSKTIYSILKIYHKNKIMNSEEILRNILECIKYLENNMMNFLDSNNEQLMEKVLIIFEEPTFNLEKHKLLHELEILEQLIPDKEKKEYFHALISKGNEAKSHFVICTAMIKFIEIFNAGDTSGQGRKCKTYCDAFPNIPKLKICDFMSLISDLGFKEEESEVYEIIKTLSNSEGLIEFIIDKLIHVEDIDNLKEGVNDYDENLIQTQTVLDLINVWYFIHQFHNYHEYSNKMLAMVNMCKEREEYKNMKEMIQGCQINLASLKNLYEEILKKDEANKQTMMLIVDGSDIEIIRSTREKWDVKLVYLSVNTKQKRSLAHANLLELRNRALLILTAQENVVVKMRNIDEKEEKRKNAEIMAKINIFIDLTNLINSLILARNELHLYGYPFFEDREVAPVYTCHAGNYADLQKAEKSLGNTLINWKAHLEKLFLKYKYYSMTHLYALRFWEIEEYFLEKMIDKDSNAENLLKFMGKSIALVHQKYPLPANSDAFDRISSLGEYLERYVPNIPQTFKTQIKIPNLDSSNIQLGKGNVFLFETDNIVKGIISLFCRQNIIPKANKMLFCSQTTTWQQIMNFMYRVALNDNSKFFLIIKPNELPQKFQVNLFNLFKQLYDMNAGYLPFGLLLSKQSGTESLISQSFKGQNYTQIFKDYNSFNGEELTQILKGVDNKRCTVVTSAISGLGKTHWIQTQALKERKELIFFPIYGNISLKSIGKRLLSIKMKENLAFCFQISTVDNQEVLIELFFQILILLTLDTPLGIIIFPTDCRFYIELSNSTPDRLSDFKLRLMNSFHTHHITDIEINLLEDSESLQIVSTYMMAYQNGTLNDCPQLLLINKEIEQYTTYIPTIESNLDISKVLILENFIMQREQDIEETSFIQLDIFLKILTENLKGFAQSEINHLRDLNPIYKDIPSILYRNIFETTKEFTTKSVGRAQRNQEIAMAKLERHLSIEEKEEELQREMYSDIITWETTNHFFVVLGGEGSFGPIYRDPNQIPEEIQNLIITQSEIRRTQGNPGEINQILQSPNKQELITNYGNLSHIELVGEFIKMFDIPQYAPILENQLLSEIHQGYVLTPDNFLKMVLIYTRVRAQVPVIIMGETGVGKTSLIKFLVENIIFLEKLEKLSLHAGISSEDIVEFITRAEAEAIKFGTRTWIFLDEFNTTNSIGLIGEIMCNRRMLGRELSPLLVFVAACNPFRIKNSKACFDDNIGIIQKNRKILSADSYKLLYTVHPLPQTMLNYIWDFGYLNKRDEFKQITAIIRCSEKIPEYPENIKEYFIDAVFESQQYLKEKEDVSSVSLRDVQRFKKLFEFFLDYSSREISKNMKSRNNLQINHIHTNTRAGILALMHCYYLRLDSKEKRKNYLDMISRKMNFNSQSITEICREEQDDYLIRMEIPPGIAKNEALRENVFAMLVCIVNKIPIFVCGKPGCSKTLAIQLILANLRGKNSQDEFFKILPEVTKVYFQGSLTCKSESIIKAFQKADKFLTHSKADEKMLPVIVFDEIGLAEVSPHNPLKVLHEKLENENILVAFIGISNWKLDASKMNRALYLARPDPDEEELVFTAKCIYAKGGVVQNPQHMEILQQLSRTYYKFRTHFKNIKDKSKQNIQNIYGLRDFYHLIQMVSYEFQKGRGDELESGLLTIAKRGMERNFDGNLEGLRVMQEIFVDVRKCHSSYIWKSTDTLELIRENLGDKLISRYLMVVTSDSSGSYILDEFLGSTLLHHRVLFCSPFSEDDEDYQIQILSDIILYLEKGVSITLRGHEKLYPSLYDLFNQSFVFSGGKRRCRIALGALFNPNCLVHDNFHCTIIMDEKEMEEQDAPFLNRFEKHYLSLMNILNEDQLNLVEKVEYWIKNITTLKTAHKKSILTSKHIFLGLSREKIAIAVHQKVKEGKVEDVIFREIIEELISLATPDFLVISYLSLVPYDEWKEYYTIYYSEHTKNFLDLLEESKQMNTNFIMIYTYSQDISKEKLEEAYQIRIKERRVGTIESETKFKVEINGFLRGHDDVFLIIVDFCNQNNYLSYLKYFLESFRTELQKRSKTICVVAQISRNYIQFENLNTPLYINWKVAFIEDLLSETVIIQLTDEILVCDSSQILKEKFADYLPRFIRSLIEKCFQTLNYQYDRSNTKLHTRIFNMLRLFCERIPKHRILIQNFEQKTLQILTNIKSDDWRINMLSNQEIYLNSKTTYEAFHNSLVLPIQISLTKILFTIEKDYALNSFFTQFNDPEIQGLNEEIWLNYFHQININIQVNTSFVRQSLITPLNFNLKFPFSNIEFKRIQFIRGEYFEQNITYENLFEEFRVKTIMGKYLGKVIETPKLQEPYFDDLLLLLLQDMYLESEDYCFTFFQSFTINCCNNIQKEDIDTDVDIDIGNNININSTFKEKLLFFIEKQDLFVILLKLLNVCARFFPMEIRVWLGLVYQVNKEEMLNTQIYTVYLIDKMLEYINPKNALDKGINTENMYIKLEEIKTKVKIITIKEKLQVNEDLFDRISYWSQFTYFVSKLSIYESEKVRFIKEMTGQYLKYAKKDIQFYSKENPFMRISDEFYSGIAEKNNVSEEIYKLFMKYKATKTLAIIKVNSELLPEMLRMIEKEQLYSYIGYDLANLLCIEGGLFEDFGLFGSGNFEFYLQSIEDMLPDTYLNQFAYYLLAYLSRKNYIRDEQLPGDLDEKYLEFFNSLAPNKSQAPTEAIIAENPIEIPLKYPILTSLRKKSFIESYLNAYARVILKSQFLPINLQNLQEIISKNKKIRNYIFESIKFEGGLKTNKSVSEFITNNMYIYKWLEQEIINIVPENTIKVFPIIFEETIHKYTLECMRGIREREGLERALNPQGWKERLGFLFGIIQVFVPLYWAGEEQTKLQLYTYSTYINTQKELIIHSLGEDVSHLVFLVTNNFISEHYLQFMHNKEIDETQIHNHLFSLSFIAIIVVFGSVSIDNPYTSLYFKQGTLSNEYSTIFNTLYPPGVPEDYITSHYKYIKLPTNYVGSNMLYQCSEPANCPYLYTIVNCGRPYAVSECPFCGLEIGGNNHNLIVREGHKNIPLTGKDAFIDRRVELRKGQILPGYNRVCVPRDSGLLTDARNVGHFAYRILHLFLHISMDYFATYKNKYQLANILGPGRKGPKIDEYEKIIAKQTAGLGTLPPNEYVTQHITKDFELLENLISLPSKQSQFWKYKIISQLPEFLLKYKLLSHSIDIQYKFEKAFEGEIMMELINNKENAINSFEQSWSKYFKLKEELSLKAHILKTGSFEDLEKSFLDGNYKIKYPLLEYFINNRENIERVKSLLPILQFSNYMRETYNLKIDRETARVRKMREILEMGDTQLDFLWDNFLKAWKDANFGGNLEYGCFRDLGNTEFSVENELIYFLIDTKEKGNGLYMAASIYILGRMHNDLIKDFEAAVCTKYPSFISTVQDTFLPLQQLSATQSISFNQDVDSLAREHSFNDLQFSKQITYNYEQIEGLILNLLAGKKKLNIEDDNIIKIQYQFEISSTLIRDIRGLIQQIALNKTQIFQMNEFILAEKEKGYESTAQCLKSILGGLETIMIDVKSSKQVNSRELIFHLIEKGIIEKNSLPIHLQIKDNCPILKYELRNIVGVYSYIENQYYPYYKQLFKELIFELDADRSMVYEAIEGFLMEEGMQESMHGGASGIRVGSEIARVIGEAVLKLIIRTFKGEIQYEEPLRIYIQDRPELWPENLIEEELDKLAKIPEIIRQKHAFFVVDYLKLKYKH